MKHLFAFLLLLPVMLAAVEVKFPRQQVPRSNTIRIDDVTLNIDRASSSSKDWMVTAKRGNETRQAIIIRNGINRLYFADLVIELQNWNIPKGESWSILAETVGDYEIRTMKPAELVKSKSAMKVTQKKVRDRTHYVFSNDLLTLECVPARNGAIVSFKDNITNREFFRNGMKDNEINLNSFQNIGFIDLFDFIGKTPQAVMDWNVKNGLIKMQGKSQMKKNTQFLREMKLIPGAFVFESKSAVKFLGGANPNVIELKHRPEFRMFKNGDERSFQILKPDANDRMHLVTPQAGTPHATTRPAYAAVDSAAGLLFGIRYQGAQQLYLWCDTAYFAPEAMGHQVSVETNPYMALSYFIIHGMSRADFLGKNVAIALPEKPMSVLEGTKVPYKVNCIIGSAVPLKKAVIVMSLKDRNGKVKSTARTAFVPPATGFATEVTASVNVKDVAAGKYDLNVRILGDNKELLNNSLPFRITAKSETELVKRYLAQINNKIAAARKEFRTTKNRQKVMKEFRQYIELREKLMTLQKTGEPVPEEIRNNPVFKGIN